MTQDIENNTGKGKIKQIVRTVQEKINHEKVE